MVPTLPPTASSQEIAATYARFQLVYIEAAHPPTRDTAATLAAFLARHSRTLRLNREQDGNPAAGWYRSLVLHPSDTPYKASLAPVEPVIRSFNPPFAPSEVLWVFWGRNYSSSSPLTGRPEHLDEVGAMGTWHWQASGVKRWRLRANPVQDTGIGELVQGVISIDCTPGSLLLVNTAAYLHQTEIPPQPGLSLSYAREFYIGCEDGIAPANTLGEAGTVWITTSMCQLCGTPTSLGAQLRASGEQLEKPTDFSTCECMCCVIRRVAARAFSSVLAQSLHLEHRRHWLRDAGPPDCTATIKQRCAVTGSWISLLNNQRRRNLNGNALMMNAQMGKLLTNNIAVFGGCREGEKPAVMKRCLDVITLEEMLRACGIVPAHRANGCLARSFRLVCRGWNAHITRKN